MFILTQLFLPLFQPLFLIFHHLMLFQADLPFPVLLSLSVHPFVLPLCRYMVCVQYLP